MFINDYYGKAAPYVKQYYDLCLRQITPNTHFTIKIDWKSDIYTDRFTDDGLTLMLNALAAVGRSTHEYKRVRRIAAQMYYLNICRNMAKATLDGTRSQLTDIVTYDPTIVTERGRTLENQLRIISYD
jgi:hypothetical protein